VSVLTFIPSLFAKTKIIKRQSYLTYLTLL